MEKSAQTPYIKLNMECVCDAFGYRILFTICDKQLESNHLSTADNIEIFFLLSTYRCSSSDDPSGISFDMPQISVQETTIQITILTLPSMLQWKANLFLWHLSLNNLSFF